MTVTESRPAGMQVRKRNGDTEPVDVNKIVRAVERCAGGLADVDPLRVATKTISGLYDGATTAELDRLSIQTAAEMTGEEPQYSRLAARLLAAYIGKEVRGQGIASFSQAIALGQAEGLVSDQTAGFVKDNARKLDDAIEVAGDLGFEYFGLRTVYDRYLLRHPSGRLVIETPQYFLLRVACGLSRSPAEAIGFYRLMSSLAYLPSSPTLFNSGTQHPQMSSCFLVDSPRDDLGSIYERYAQVAQLSKFSGGIGISWSRVRSRGALIRGTNGQSNGIVPWLRTLDASVAAVNQGGRRKGAACAYLEPWHPDIEEFRAARAAPDVRPDAGRGRPVAARSVGRDWQPGRAVGGAARARRRDRAAQFAANRDRADRHHRLHRRMLRVHRAAGLQPVQARNHVR
jgi:ribonucleoside-diphosphate reductase alpha chain